MSNATPNPGPDELELISRVKAKLPVGDSVVVGAGDDCAVIDAGDVVIDGSLKGKLARLQTALAN